MLDISKILDELRKELEQVEEAILSMERLAIGTGRRRGRPPAWMSKLKQDERHKDDEHGKDGPGARDKATRSKEPPASASG